MGNHPLTHNLKPSKFKGKPFSLLITMSVGSVIVITGASSGMGKEMTFKYAYRGANIVIGSRSLDKLKEV